ncbi:DUF1697 domain-containing protein [Tetragenococcus halophilus]|uniref:DUF1697 domain-containing protein n=3 Tax=Tetragenococcus halophilus TaxID=51669 RepID=A0A3G5FK23_TETHA|nr:DUF1697 domain-containing protein [Tetragenococcus halophilus]AYW50706.1 DUF1697 domain-containing protein [Tetragenococcus halophilus]MCF1684364.1 DUF1697 domain-containing protein [Tetragenococcus halophilus]
MLKTLMISAFVIMKLVHIQRDNIVLQSSLTSTEITSQLESLLVQNFELDSELVNVLALEHSLYQKIIEEAPKTFGDSTTEIDYRYEVMFLMEVTSDEVMKVVSIREGIDRVWQGRHVVYYRRPGPKHPDYNKSALSRIIKKPIYQSITMRNWKTTTKMNELLNTL